MKSQTIANALCIISVLLGVSLCDVRAGAAERPMFKVDVGGQAEKFFLVEESNSPIDPSSHQPRLGRVVNPNGHFTYRIPTAGMSKCVLNLEMGNRYRISASTDNTNWRELAVAKDAAGLSNYGTYPVEITPLLPTDKVYVKFEDPQNQGFGCWLHSITVLSDREMPLPRMFLDLGGNRTLSCSLDSVYGGSVSPRIPKNNATASIAIHGSVLNVQVKCGYTPGYKPFALAKTRDNIGVFTDDCVELFVANAAAPSDYRHFAINAANTQFDELRKDPSANWNWRSSAEVEKDSWVANFSIDLAETGLHVSHGDSLLLCISRFDGDSGLICVTSPLSGGLHQPNAWTKVDLLDRSAAVPKIRYDSAYACFDCPENLPEKTSLLVQDTDNNTVFSDVAEAGRPYTKKFVFAKPGGYTIYAYTESGLSALFPVYLSSKDVDKFPVKTTSPIYYLGETAAIDYALPKGEKRSRLNVTVSSGGAIMKARVRIKGDRILIHGLPVGEYEVKLSLSDGQDAAIVKLSMRECRTVPSKVEISRDGYIRVDGKPFVPMVMYLASDFADCRAHGFNVMLTGSDDPKYAEWIDSDRRILDDAEKQGVKVIFHLCNLLRGNSEDYDSISLIVATLKNHPALFGWYIADEPSSSDASGHVTVDKLRNAYNTIKAIDSNHPVMILDNVPSMLRTYAPYCDILASDPYPVYDPSPNVPLSMVADWTSATLDASRNKCILICLQCFGKPFSPRCPTLAEEKTMLNYALNGGAKMIGWWAEGFMHGIGYWDSYTQLTHDATAYIQKMDR
jgi:hypothetical protein